MLTYSSLPFFPEPFSQGGGASGKTCKFNFSEVQTVLTVTVTGTQSPCLYLDPRAFFSPDFLLYPVEEGSE